MDRMTPYYNRDGIVIYCGDNASVMAGLEPNTDLTVTSPPYDNLRDYNGYDWDFDKVSSELFRLTVKGGVVVWVVGDATINGSETLESFRQALHFKDLGFYVETMIYEKDSLSFPETTRYTQIFEYMFILSNGPTKTFNPIIDKPNKWANGRKHIKGHYTKVGGGRARHNKQNLLREFGSRFNIWRISTGYQKSTKDKLPENHPAIFPEALARDHIISWSNPNDLILDPFLGSGTTLKMAQQLGRKAIGIELSEEYCQIAVERLRQPSFFSLPQVEVKETPKQATLI